MKRSFRASEENQSRCDHSEALKLGSPLNLTGHPSCSARYSYALASDRARGRERRDVNKGGGPRPTTVMKEVLVKRLSRSVSFIFILLIAVMAVPAFAGVVPSKTAVNQSIAQREADLAMIRDVVAHDEVATVLAQHGLTQQQVNDKVAQLSPQDLHQLAHNLDQLQAAGLTEQEWIWVGLGALAALILVVALG